MNAERLAECPDNDAVEIRAIEIAFAIPVRMTERQQRHIYDAVRCIVGSPWNQFKDGVHWVAEGGSKPDWSVPGKPSFDDSVFCLGTASRAFLSEEERDRYAEHRKNQFIRDIQCPECGPTIIVTDYCTGQDRPESGICCKCEEMVYFATLGESS